MKKCPFCAEEIKDEAIKCRHCGSMLNDPKPMKYPDYSDSARDMAQGIKKKEQDDLILNFLIFLSMAFGGFVGIMVGYYSKSSTAGWIFGIGTIFLLACLSVHFYYKK